MTSKVHRVRFYNPKPLAVNCLSFNKLENLLALSREDASIEIWDMKYNPYLLKSIAGFEKGSIEALCWVKTRLISTGMGGALVEWDLDKLTTKWSAVLTGYVAWCLDVDAACNLVAVGTEQGYLNLFRVEEDQFVYEKLFDKQEGRIICCKFDKSGNTLVTGSISTIRIWDVATGLARHRLNVSRRGKESLVWSVAVLSDMTIVAGDSDGRLTFWDGNLAEQLESFTTHKADILSVAVTDDEQTLYCSGVDPTIVSFNKVGVASRGEAGPRTQWVRSVVRNVHQHDVRVLGVQDDTLMSVGADGYLALSRYPPKWLTRVPPLPPAPRVAAAAAGPHKLLLLRYNNRVEVWKLGKYSVNKKGNPQLMSKHNEATSKDDSISKNGSRSKGSGIEQDSDVIIHNLQKSTNELKLEEGPIKLVSIRAKGKRSIKCCAMSPNGKYVMYATDDNIRVFNLELGESEEDTSLVKLPLLAPPPACSRAAFTAAGRLLLLGGARVAVLALHADSGLALQQLVDVGSHLKEGTALNMECATTAGGATYLACADSLGGVAVWRDAGAGGGFSHHASLPQYKCAASAMAFEPAGETLAVTYVDNTIREYDLRSCRLAEWEGGGWAGGAAASGLTYHPRDPRTLLVYDHNAVTVLHAGAAHKQDENYEPPGKKNSATRQKVKTIPCKYLAGLAWLGRDEAVLVEVPPDHIISQLPPVLATKKFADV